MTGNERHRLFIEHMRSSLREQECDENDQIVDAATEEEREEIRAELERMFNQLFGFVDDMNDSDC